MRIKLIICLMISLTIIMTNTIYAKYCDSVVINADTIDYNSATSIISANGNVSIIYKNFVITGQNAIYNKKTQEKYITGGVKAVNGATILTAKEIRDYNMDYISALGCVVIVRGKSQLLGGKADYYEDKQYAIVTEGSQFKNADGILSAEQIELFFSEDKIIGEGNVHIINDSYKFNAYANKFIYYNKIQTGISSKLILVGRATVMQDSNCLTGEKLTIYINDKAIKAQGCTKLIIKS